MTPQFLNVDDVVKCSVKQRYVNWIVREVSLSENGTQKVVASKPGQGSVRFTWNCHEVEHARCGSGHGMRFLFVRHAKEAQN